MSEPFKSQALEANLEQTRYKDIFIPEELRKILIDDFVLSLYTTKLIRKIPFVNKILIP